MNQVSTAKPCFKPNASKGVELVARQNWIKRRKNRNGCVPFRRMIRKLRQLYDCQHVVY
jgi:hypothetical protein